MQPEAAPPPPPSSRRRSPILATASGVLSFLGIAAVVAIALVSFGLQKMNARGPLQDDKVVYVEGGKGDIVDRLEQEGVIDNPLLMQAGMFLHGEQKLKAGEYQFKGGASLNDVIDTLVAGKPILHSITIPEGLTSEQIVQRLMDDDVLVGTVRTVPKDGTLMPDTYKFTRGTKREQIIGNMQQEQKKVVADVWSHRASDTLLKSPYEMLTLASIVEKETGKADERPRVAGVFVNRLSRNIPLQSDPTIVYGLVGGKGTLGRGILKSEIEQKTPYNTYTIVGLPPGPICNPGRAAMEAAADPAKTRDIYFVADGTGGHAFAETLAIHKANVLRYRALEREAKDKLPPDSDKLLQIAPVGGQTKPNQRSDAQPSVPVFGALDLASFGPRQGEEGDAIPLKSSDLPMSLSFADGDVLSRVKPMLPGPEPVQAGEGDELGGIPGVDTSPPAGSAEEQALADAGSGDGSMMTFPVPAARRAEEKAQAAQYGLAAGPDHLPPQAELISTDPAASAVRSPTAPKPRALDASEGTKLDPLLNKTYDLNTAKTVPSFALAGATSAPTTKRK